MSDVIRHATIVIDMVAGKVSIPAPNLDPVLNARREELELLDQLEVSTRKAWAAQEKLTQAASDKQAAQALEAQVAATEKLQQSNAQLVASVNVMASGFFRVSRAAVLLGSDADGSLTKLVQGLAYVHAAFDLFKGTQAIVKGLTLAKTASAAAVQAETAAVALNTAAWGANALAQRAAGAAGGVGGAAGKGAAAAGAGAASAGAGAAAAGAGTAAAGAASGGVMAAAGAAFTFLTGPIGLTIMGVTAAVVAGTKAWDYYTESEEEAAEAARKLLAAAEAQVAALRAQQDAANQVADLRRETMTPGERADSRHESHVENVRMARSAIEQHAGGPGEQAARQAAAQAYQQAAQYLKQEQAARKEILDTQLAGVDAQIKQVQAAEDAVKAAKQQQAVEQEKVRAFQAQAGSLSKLEQRQLVKVRDKLRAGENITAFEENILAQNGGEQGRNIVDARRAHRGEAAGFDKDFFKGIEGASTGLDDAAKALREAAENLNRQTGGQTAEAKIAELEKEKTALNAKYNEFAKEFKAAMDLLVAFMEANNKQMAALADAAASAGR